MTQLPIGSQVVFPDRVKRPKPSDGTCFHDSKGNLFTWDDLLHKWVNLNGEIITFYEWHEINESSSAPATSFKTKQATPEENRLKKFFFPKKNLDGCICGSWAVDSVNHAPYCPLWQEKK